jgi:2-epi-5-epi-valiolone synthase
MQTSFSKTYTSSQEVHTQIAYSSNIFRDHWLQHGHNLLGDSERRLIFVDEYFYRLGNWRELINEYFDAVRFEVTIVPVHCSEDKKDLENLMFILGEIERFNVLRRSEPIIAIGGGVLMDMVGFAASIFRRGVPYIKVPTTLLGMVDAGLGAKTSINHFERRNRLGSYFPPIVTIIDQQFLKTLDPKEIAYALGEIIKIATIKDEQLFCSLQGGIEKCLESNFNCVEGQYIVRASIGSMMEELTPNLWEKDLKRVVDFGHTFSPIPEMQSLTDKGVPTLSHGEAVALDVLFSCKLSVGRNFLHQRDYERVENLVKKSGLPTTHPYFKDPYLLWDSLLDASRHRNGNQNVPVPESIGKGFFLQDITLDEIKEVIE